MKVAVACEKGFSVVNEDEKDDQGVKSRLYNDIRILGQWL